MCDGKLSPGAQLSISFHFLNIQDDWKIRSPSAQIFELENRMAEQELAQMELEDAFYDMRDTLDRFMDDMTRILRETIKTLPIPTKIKMGRNLLIIQRTILLTFDCALKYDEICVFPESCDTESSHVAQWYDFLVILYRGSATCVTRT